MKTIISIIAIIASFSVSAQQNYWGQNVNGGNWQGNTYNGQQAMQVQQVKLGTVIDLRRVEIIQPSQGPSYGGAGLGAVVGGLLGNQIGNGTGRTAATVLLTAIGGAAGESIGSAPTKAQALEIIVRMESGETLAITQALDNDAASLRNGDRVRLIQSQGWGGTTRVSRMTSM